MTPVATIIIPCAPHHEPLLPRAVASVENQTVPTIALVKVDRADKQRQGPAGIRNELLAQVETEFVGFLDADDWLEPTFVAHCQPVAQAGTYAYTDWFFDERIKEATNTPWLHEDDWHLVTVLMRTDDARRVGPFDETLAAMEDTDWFLKAALYDICGKRVPKALVHYTAAGRRSQQALRNGQLHTIKLRLKERYAYKMGCCLTPGTADMHIPAGERQPGDVLAMALWGGNHAKHGKGTGRRYPRMSYPKTTWVDPRDVERDPAAWRIVDVPKVEAAPVNGNGHTPERYEDVGGFAQAVIDAGMVKPPPSIDLDHPGGNEQLMNPDVLSKPYIPPLAETIAPDYARLVELGVRLYAK